MRKKLIIIATCIFLFCCWFIVIPTFDIANWQYFGLFRYERVRSTFCTNSVAIEPRMFAYKYDFPYFYSYGVSGYSKVNIIFFGKIEKIVNEEYDVTRPNGVFGNLTTSIDRLREEFGNRLILKNSLQEVSKEDLAVYKKLKMEGNTDKERFFTRMMIKYPMYKQIEESLDKL